ncbi:MAG: hypothetical protein HY456_02880 [Parcubacteria group bacterium]|nr:hypothetical protein [Parcubacteria group bacterium]
MITIFYGFVNNYWLVIVFMILIVVYTRNEDTLTRSYVLRDCPTRELKATYLSMLAFAEAVNGIWIPILLGYLASVYGIQSGYIYFGGTMLLVAGILFVFYLYSKKVNLRDFLNLG